MPGPKREGGTSGYDRSSPQKPREEGLFERLFGDSKPERRPAPPESRGTGRGTLPSSSREGDRQKADKIRQDLRSRMEDQTSLPASPRSSPIPARKPSGFFANALSAPRDAWRMLFGKPPTLSPSPAERPIPIAADVPKGRVEEPAVLPPDTSRSFPVAASAYEERPPVVDRAVVPAAPPDTSRVDARGVSRVERKETEPMTLEEVERFLSDEWKGDLSALVEWGQISSFLQERLGGKGFKWAPVAVDDVGRGRKKRIPSGDGIGTIEVDDVRRSIVNDPQGDRVYRGVVVFKPGSPTALLIPRVLIDRQEELFDLISEQGVPIHNSLPDHTIVGLGALPRLNMDEDGALSVGRKGIASVTR